MSHLPLHGFNGLFYLEMARVESVCPQLRKRWFCPVGVCHPQSNLRLFICLISLVEELNYYIISRVQAWLCAYLIWPAQVYHKQILWYSSLKSATFFTANVMQTVRRSSLSSAQISCCCKHCLQRSAQGLTFWDMQQIHLSWISGSLKCKDFQVKCYGVCYMGSQTGDHVGPFWS